MTIVIGSARSDERGQYSGGLSGDQKQGNVSGDDYRGEVSLQNFYVHKKGWVILRAKDPAQAEGLARAMKTACNNVHIGYDQSGRNGILQYGTAAKIKTECDCSSLVRQCIKEATGKDPGQFTTANEVTKLMGTGLFTKTNYTPQDTLYVGDILVTKTKGHTAIVVYGNARMNRYSEKREAIYYPKYTGDSVSIVDALAAVGSKSTGLNARKKIAAANGIQNYTGTAVQNRELLKLIKSGKLVRE